MQIGYQKGLRPPQLGLYFGYSTEDGFWDELGVVDQAVYFYTFFLYSH